MKLYTIKVLGILFLFKSIVLYGGGALPSEEFQKEYAQIKDVLNTDIVSPEVMQSLVDEIKTIAERGSKGQQESIKDLISEKQKQTKYTLSKQLAKAIKSLFYSKNIQSIASILAVPAITGGLSGSALQLLILASSGATTGQAMVSAASMGAVMGIVDNLVQAAEGGALVKGTSRLVVEELISGAKAAVGGKGLLFPIKGPLGAAMQAIAASSFEQAVKAEGGWIPILKKFQWAGAVVPETKEQKALIVSQGPLFKVLTEKFERFFSDRTVRNYLAATTVSTLQAAVMAMILYQLGLGYRGETIISTLSYAGLRGAFEGIFNYATYSNLNLGIISQSATGIIGRTLQKYITTGTQLALGDITPLTLHAVSTSVVNQIVVKAGGWRNTVKNIVDYASQTKWIPYNPLVSFMPVLQMPEEKD